MLEDIELKKFPCASGVYWFKDVDGLIVYVGSSKDLYKRMAQHRALIKKGSQVELYQFLKTNQFTVDFQLEENYRQIEQQLIEKCNPKFNHYRAYTGCGAYKGRRADWKKEYRDKYKEEYLRQSKQYRESHKEEIIKQRKQYHSQLCNYKGEVLTLNALRKRFQKQGIPHPVLEAKKYLVS